VWISSYALGSQESLPDHAAHSSRCIVHHQIRLDKTRYGLANNSVLELKALPRDTEVNLVAQRRHGTARWISISRGKNCLDVHLAGITSFNTFPFVRKW
jgi:hypothetical protein